MKHLGLFLLIAMLVLAGCGGSTPDDGGDTGDGGGDVTEVNLLDRATGQGAIELDTPVEGEMEGEDDAHAYTFEGTSGNAIIVHIQATGSFFTTPYTFLYDPDGTQVASSDVSESSRSNRYTYTLEADGTYTVVVAPYEGVGVASYQLTVTADDD